MLIKNMTKMGLLVLMFVSFFSVGLIFGQEVYTIAQGYPIYDRFGHLTSLAYNLTDTVDVGYKGTWTYGAIYDTSGTYAIPT